MPRHHIGLPSPSSSPPVGVLLPSARAAAVGGPPASSRRCPCAHPGRRPRTLILPLLSLISLFSIQSRRRHGNPPPELAPPRRRLHIELTVANRRIRRAVGRISPVRPFPVVLDPPVLHP